MECSVLLHRQPPTPLALQPCFQPFPIKLRQPPDFLSLGQPEGVLNHMHHASTLIFIRMEPWYEWWGEGVNHLKTFWHLIIEQNTAHKKAIPWELVCYFHLMISSVWQNGNFDLSALFANSNIMLIKVRSRFSWVASLARNFLSMTWAHSITYLIFLLHMFHSLLKLSHFNLGLFDSFFFKSNFIFKNQLLKRVQNYFFGKKYNFFEQGHNELKLFCPDLYCWAF